MSDYNISERMWPQVELMLTTTFASAGYFEITLVLAFFCWLFSARVSAMMELMSTKLYEVCRGPDGPGGTGLKQSSSSLHHQLTQFQLRKREQLCQARSSSVNSFESSLYSIKENGWNQLLEQERRPLIGLSCSTCCPTSRLRCLCRGPSFRGGFGALFNELLGNQPRRNYHKLLPQTENLPVLNFLQVESMGRSSKGLFASAFPILKSVLDSPGVTKANYPYIYDSVLQDENVKKVVRESAESLADEMGITDNRGRTLVFEKEWKRAVCILNLMHSRLSNGILGFCSWLFYYIIPWIFTSVSIPKGQIEMLQKAASRGLPIVFLPLHRSHVDYIAITFSITKAGLYAPIVAAGENLRISFFGRLLRGLGAFFIRRSMSPALGRKDQVYKSVLHNYMIQCLQAGYNFEFYIEGGRTRTGKPCLPKAGLMSIFVDAYLSGVIEDALLVPLSVNYDRLVDGHFVNELTGEPKKPESFVSAVKGIWKALTTNCGVMRIDFNQPFSLHELVRSFQNKSKNLKGGFHVCSSMASLYGTEIVVEEQRQLVDSIARHILYDCSQSVAVMSTNAVAFLLLYCYRQGASLAELTNALDKLRDQLASSSKDTGFTGESKDIIDHAVSLLGPGLVQTEKRGEELFIKPVTVVPNVIELSYYSNTLLAHFCLEGIVARVLLFLTEDNEEAKISLDRIIDLSIELCDILQFEFIFSKSCQNLNDIIFDVVDKMATQYDLLCKISIPMTGRPGVGCPRNLEIIDDDEDDDEDRKMPSLLYKVNCREERLLVYGRLMSPLIDAYSTVVRYLPALMGREVAEVALVKELLAVVKKGQLLERIPYGESLSSEAIKNCLKLLEKWSVIDCHTVDGTKVLYLNSKFDQEMYIEPIISRIQRFQLSSLNP